MSAHVVYSAIDPDFSRDDVADRRHGDHARGDRLRRPDFQRRSLDEGAAAARSPNATRAVFAAGLDIALHCNGDLTEARAVAEATPELAGASLRRAEAALKRVAGGPQPFDAAAAAPSSRRCLRPRRA